MRSGMLVANVVHMNKVTIFGELKLILLSRDSTILSV